MYHKIVQNLCIDIYCIYLYKSTDIRVCIHILYIPDNRPFVVNLKERHHIALNYEYQGV